MSGGTFSVGAVGLLTAALVSGAGVVAGARVAADSGAITSLTTAGLLDDFGGDAGGGAAVGNCVGGATGVGVVEGAAVGVVGVGVDGESKGSVLAAVAVISLI